MGDLCDNIGFVGVSAKHATIFHNSLPTSMVFGGAKDCCKLSILLAVPSFAGGGDVLLRMRHTHKMVTMETPVEVSVSQSHQVYL